MLPSADRQKIADRRGIVAELEVIDEGADFEMIRVLRHQHRRSQEDRRNQKNQKAFHGFVSSWLSLYPRTLLPSPFGNHWSGGQSGRYTWQV